MTALSLHLPEKIAQASQEAAEQMGISRMEFIRQAIVHELEEFHAQQERDAMAKSFAAMRKRKDYMKMSKELDNGFDDDKEGWWTGRK